MPLTLHGEGNYGLTDIKEIKVTKDFLSLGPSITDCQHLQYKADCDTKQYQQSILSACKCSPLHLKTFFTPETPICVHEDVDCVSSVRQDGECLERCEGLILDVMKTPELRQDKDEYREIFDMYEKYKSPNVSEFSYFKKDLYDLRGNVLVLF